MKRLLTAIALIIISSTSACANNNAATGAIVGAVLFGASAAYLDQPVYYQRQYPLNPLGGVMPLNKGGSLNPNRTTVQTNDGVTDVIEYTDIYGDRHIEVNKYDY